MPTNEAVIVSLDNNSSRCTVSISSQPKASNNYSLKLYLNDSAGGAAWCDFTITWMGDFSGSMIPTVGNIGPTITDVVVRKHYPWNGEVDIDYTVVDDIAPIAKNQGMLTSLKVTATDWESGLTYTATSVSGDASLAEGTHNIVCTWNELTFYSTNVIFSVSCIVTPALYCVIDLSAGSSASSYPITYLANPPSGGFNVDTYKTEKLVLRRIEPGTFMMCGEYQTTLTKPYYMGVFEMTQKQYSLVTGSNPSQYKNA